jgi:ADP-ribose pyrophosphatase YjhB (NUDIX family)
VSELRIRPAVRAVVLDPAERVLLVRFELPDAAVWATPGGGIEPGEREEDAIRRELGEELGLDGVELGPVVWTRTHVRPFIDGRWDGQSERYYLVRTPSFEPKPRLSWEQLNAEYVTAIRWWDLGELERSRELFAPRRLPALLRSLIDEGPPAQPVDAGV